MLFSDADPDQELTFCEKTHSDQEPFFNFGSSRSLRCHFLVKNIGEMWLSRSRPESEQGSDFQI